MHVNVTNKQTNIDHVCVKQKCLIYSLQCITEMCKGYLYSIEIYNFIPQQT